MEIPYYEKYNDNIDKEPTFAWWVPSSLKHINVMISKAAMKLRKNKRFGISIPDTYNKAVGIVIINGNAFWKDATKKEINNVELDLKFIYDGGNSPIGFNKISGHLICDVKFDLISKSISLFIFLF